MLGLQPTHYTLRFPDVALKRECLSAFLSSMCPLTNWSDFNHLGAVSSLLFYKNILVIAHLFAALSFLLLQWKTFVSWSLISRIYIKLMQKKYLFLTSTLKIVAVDWEHSLHTHHMFSTRNVVLRSDSWAEHMLIKGRHFPVSLTVSLAVYSWNANNLCSVQRYN